MDEHDLPQSDTQAQSQERLERLSRRPTKKAQNNTRHSAFIRRMRIVLPLIAGVIIAILFAWHSFQNSVIPTLEDAVEIPKSVGKNELINPRFESIDKKQQPYTITAERAVQEKNNENLVILEKPDGDMMLKDGAWVALRADQGAFRQDSQQLFLKGAVEIFHDLGYQLKTEQLHINIKNHTAWSDVDIYIHGPKGTLEARGLKANSESEHLIFTGPARLVLINTSNTITPKGGL